MWCLHRPHLLPLRLRLRLRLHRHLRLLRLNLRFAGTDLLFIQILGRFVRTSPLNPRRHLRQHRVRRVTHVMQRGYVSLSQRRLRPPAKYVLRAKF